MSGGAWLIIPAGAAAVLVGQQAAAKGQSIPSAIGNIGQSFSSLGSLTSLNLFNNTNSTQTSAQTLHDSGVPNMSGNNLPRGIRDKNPGNLINNGINWQGATGTDGRYLVFDTAVDGIRAIASTLNTYRHKHGLNTVRGIISRWAPPKNNDTTAYIRAVANHVSEGADQPLPDTLSTNTHLIAAIIHHENGMQPYSDQTIHKAIQEA